jgi:hypothetical protein
MRKLRKHAQTLRKRFCVCALYAQTCANKRKHTPMFAQVLQLPDQYQALRKHAQTCANMFKHVQTLRKHVQTLCKHCTNTAQTQLRKQ